MSRPRRCLLPAGRQPGEPATRNRPPNPQHAKNPEGASTEVCALSGFSLLPELQDPEGSGLPVGAQHHLSVVPAPTVSCLTAGPNNVKPTHPHRNPKRRFVFATTNLNFATTPNNQHHTNRHRPNKPQTKPQQNHWLVVIPGWVVAVDTQAGPKRERPRGSVRRSIHPLGVLKPKPAFAGSSLRSPKAAKLRSGPKPAPKAGLCPRPKPGFETSPCPGRSPISVARPLRSGSPLPGRTSHDRPSQPEGLLFRCSLARASSEETGLPFR